MTPILKRALHLGGSSLALIGIAFVAMRLHDYWQNQNFSDVRPLVWVIIAGLAIAYGLANLLLALAWRQLLGQCDAYVTPRWSIKIYGVSQLAKYVPGNVFHFAGRQAMGMSAGVSSSALAKSTVLELGLISLSGVLYGWLIFPKLVPQCPWIASISLLIGTFLCISYLLRRFIGFKISVAFGFQMLFLAVSAVVFVILLDSISPNLGLNFQTWLMIAGAYLVAWLIGLVTPGAPAGVGVRELVLLLLLKSLTSDADLLMAVLLSRTVTVVGDLLFFIISFVTPAKICFEESDFHVPSY